MAGTKGKSGRKKTTGRLYRLNVRYRPERHSPELKELLDLVESAGMRGADILDRVAAGGVAAARQAAEVEVVETAALLNDLFG